MGNHNKIALTAFWASVFALCVIAIGAFTRLIDAGLGCPDWPGCYGQFTVPTTSTERSLIPIQFPNSSFEGYKAWAEMIHRYFVGGLSLFILVLIGMVFSKPKNRTRGNVLLALFLIALLSYQILLGRWTVTLQLLPIIVTQHLLGGFLILSVLWLLFLINRSFLINRHQPTPLSHLKKNLLLSFKTASIIGLILLLVQIFLGAWTSTNYAALSCPDFPFCHSNGFKGWNFTEAFQFFSPVGVNYEGGVLSDSARQTIHSIHRLGALVVTLYLMSLGTLGFVFLSKNKAILKNLYVLFGLLFLQISLGISNVLFQLPLFSGVAHNIVAALLLIALLTLTFQLNKETPLKS